MLGKYNRPSVGPPPGGGGNRPYSHTVLGRGYYIAFLKSNMELGIKIVVTQTNMYTVN